MTTKLHVAVDVASEDSPAFPVLKKIAGMNWEGSCNYVNQELIPASFKLTGGIRFDLPPDNDDDDVDDDDTVELNSFIVLPTGKRREIQMRYVPYNSMYTNNTNLILFPSPRVPSR